MASLSFLFQLLSLISTLIVQSQSSTLPLQLLWSANQNPPPSLSVLDFGAVGDGIHYDTLPIQSTIDACASLSAVQCRVRFPPGNYLTATIHLRNGVVLDIEKGARVLGGTKLGDYPREFERWYVVAAENVSDVGITGGGEINGQGLEFVKRFDKRKNVMVSWNQTGQCFGDECRPRLVGFVNCRNVRVWNINLIQPAYWWISEWIISSCSLSDIIVAAICSHRLVVWAIEGLEQSDVFNHDCSLHIVRCENTSIHDVYIHGDFNTPNNDGIDIDDSNNTVITKCKIDTGDDAICPKTYTGPLYNLTATDCWIRTKSSAIKLGSASWFDFKGLVFDNITIADSHRGLGFQIRDGGNVDGITFSNINISTRYYDPSWWGRAEPIYVTSCPRHSKSKAGLISNLLFVNITANSENGIFLSGSKGGLLRNIKVMNMDVTYRRYTNYAGGLVDYRPGCAGLVNHSTAGIIMEHIDGLVIDNVNMRWSEYRNGKWNNPLDFRPSTVNNISFVNFYSGLERQEDKNQVEKA
ncbi:Pectate lyase superfamily protein [Dillenia turbinata]|uniref:Pectate lyase superfamily protein n=1 Tax=Dillenia turbinata TaxID=194707 RepID=A0AAN8W3E7_9MAGN